MKRSPLFLGTLVSWWFVLPLVFVPVLTSCEKKPVATEASAFALKTVTLQIANKRITAEVADTPSTMQTGLMYRKSMPEDHGMIFVFSSERQASFWMRNTHIPLDIAYLDRTGKILEIHAAKPLDETPLPSATSNIAYVLEMNQGWFAKKKIPTGTQITGLPPFPSRQ
jgi:hypothetical protein